MVTISLIANCQDTVYFDKNQNRIDKHSASSFQIKRDDPSFPGRFIVETFYVNGSRKEIRYYTDRTEKYKLGFLRNGILMVSLKASKNMSMDYYVILYLHSGRMVN